MAVDTTCKSADGFEVVEAPFLRNALPTSGEAKATETDRVDLGTAGAEIQAQVDGLREELGAVARKVGNKAVVHDRRVRTLEYCFDDCEAEIQSLNKNVEIVKGKADRSLAKLEALGDLPRLVDETNLLAQDNSTRVDRLIVKYLPSVEVKVQALKLEQEKRFQQAEFAIDDINRKTDGINPSEMSDVRRIAAEANLRARSVEQRLPELKAELLMALATELACAQESARSDRAHAEGMVERLSKEHMDMWEDARQLSLRVKRTEETAQNLADTVVPFLEHKVQRQRLLLNCRDAEINETRQAADARDALLSARVQRLERSLSCAESYAVQNAELKRRLSALEATVERLSATSDETLAPAQDVHTPEAADAAADVVDLTLVRSIKAEILRRAIRAELCKRYRRRQQLAISRQLSASAIRAAALRVALSGEIRRRKQRRCERTPQHPRKFTPSVAALRAACIRRELRAHITRLAAPPSVAALRAACIRRELRAEITRRQAKGTFRRAPSAAAIRAACIRMEIRAEIVRREAAALRRRASRITRGAIKAEILRRALAAEICRRNAAAAAAASKTPKSGTLAVYCKTAEGDVSLTVQVPGFVSVRYLKQLIYFKGSCAMHPATMDLVYCGQVLDDGWKVGGGVFAAPTLLRCELDESKFRGIDDGATVYILVKGCYTSSRTE